MKRVWQRVIIALALILWAMLAFLLWMRPWGVIDLGPVDWKLLGGNTSVLCDKNGQTLVGPGLITFWAKYPDIYGYVLDEKTREDHVFILNVKNHTVRYPKDLRGYALSEYGRGLMVTFQTLKGQWADARRKAALLEILKPDNPAAAVEK